MEPLKATIPKMHRSPGPAWGFRMVRICHQYLPPSLFSTVRRCVSAVAAVSMHRQRRYSSDYLEALFQKEVSFGSIWNHFDAFSEYFCDRVECAFGNPVAFRWQEGHGQGFEQWIHHSGPLLLGTFHFGYSDLIGFFMQHFQKKIHMLRLRMENSGETEMLQQQAGDFLQIIWVNQMEDAVFRLKEVIHQGGTVAMQCDRPNHASRLRGFQFLGETRSFPFTIYLMSILFDTPVLFVVASSPDADGQVPLYTSPVFHPNLPTKDENIRAAHEHFQSFLNLLESLLHENPFQWFNFTPLNPVHPAGADREPPARNPQSPTT